MDEQHNMQLKPFLRLRLRHSDVPLQVPFANGFAILSQTPPSMSRRLTGCYTPMTSIQCLGFVLATIISSSVFADSSEFLKIRLTCEYESTLDLKDGKISKTAGKELLTIYYREPTGPVVVEAKDEMKSRLFEGTQSEVEIIGSSTLEHNGRIMKEELKVNRYTGRFSRSLSVDDEGLLVHSGGCEAVDRKF